MLLRTIRFRLLLRLIQCARPTTGERGGVVGKYCRGKQRSKESMGTRKGYWCHCYPVQYGVRTHVAKNTQIPRALLAHNPVLTFF